jgi:methoxymalonate biosynthesis acyl carrier protein
MTRPETAATTTSKDKIRSFLLRQLRVQQLEDGDDIFAAGFMSSLFAMQLVVFVEREFGITVQSEDLELANFQSVNAITALVERRAAERA